MLTPGDHRPDCTDPSRVVTFAGTQGDRMARCKSCKVVKILEGATPLGTCVACGKATNQEAWRYCGPCNIDRKAAPKAAPEDTAAPVTPQAEPIKALPLRGRVCPDCVKTPSRDQRAWRQDGRCRKCWGAAHDKGRRKPEWVE